LPCIQLEIGVFIRNGVQGTQCEDQHILEGLSKSFFCKDCVWHNCKPKICVVSELHTGLPLGSQIKKSSLIGPQVCAGLHIEPAHGQSL
jgi:hypothetical protein